MIPLQPDLFTAADNPNVDPWLSSRIRQAIAQLCREGQPHRPRRESRADSRGWSAQVDQGSSERAQGHRLGGGESMTVSLSQIPRSLRQRIREDGSHWVWAGSYSVRDGFPIFGGVGAAYTVMAATGEYIAPGEGVFRDCDKHGCVHPEHQIIKIHRTPKAS